LLLVNYNEIGLKKSNRRYFENKLLDQVFQRTGHYGLKKVKNLHKKYLLTYDNEDKALRELKNIFGIHKIRLVKTFPLDDREALIYSLIEDLRKSTQNQEKTITYGVFSKRINKKYELNSIEFSREVGDKIGEAFPHWKVDLTEPDIKVECEIEREYLIGGFQCEDGLGGLPYNSGGRALLLLSGGLDSPVAGWLMAKRGLAVDGIHFHAPPFTSPMLTLKIEKLAKRLAYYQNFQMNLYMVNIAEILKVLSQKVPKDYNVVMQRRIMFKIASRIAQENGYQALITGDNLGQVASQTVYNMAAVNQALEDIPVFRPLIAYEKNETIKIARKIDTFFTSIEPLEDCCTVFVAKHPVTKANLKSIRIYENRLQSDDLIQDALNQIFIQKIEFILPDSSKTE